MREFLHINKGKWGFIFGRLLIGAAIIWIFLFFLPLNDKPGLLTLLGWYAIFSIGLAFLLLLLLFTGGYFSFRRQRQMFAREPLSIFFDKYHFQTCLINSENRWRMTKEIKKGLLDSYTVLIFSSPGKPQSINTVIEIEWTEKEDC